MPSSHLIPGLGISNTKIQKPISMLLSFSRVYIFFLREREQV